MVESTKIKFFTIVGTVAIISTSYILHANTFYTQLYRDIESSYSQKMPSSEESLATTNLKPSKTIEKGQMSNIESTLKDNKLAIKEEIVEKEVTNIEVVEIHEPVIQEPIKKEALNIEVVEIQEPIKKQVANIEVVEKQEPVIQKANSIKSDKNKVADRLLTFKKYLYLKENGELTNNTKKLLDEIIPDINNISNYYLEVEGYSAKSALAKELSYKYAQEVANYLKSKVVNKKIVVIGYSDDYPIIDNKMDIRNSRIELKFRKEEN